MKTLKIIIALFVISSCAPMMPLEELEAEALITGDWTKVEKREAKIKYPLRQKAFAKTCTRQDKIVVCEERFRRSRYGLEHCFCGVLNIY